jgi:hypothetical protein
MDNLVFIKIKNLFSLRGIAMDLVVVLPDSHVETLTFK